MPAFMPSLYGLGLSSSFFGMQQTYNLPEESSSLDLIALMLAERVSEGQRLKDKTGDESQLAQLDGMLEYVLDWLRVPEDNTHKFPVNYIGPEVFSRGHFLDGFFDRTLRNGTEVRPIKELCEAVLAWIAWVRSEMQRYLAFIARNPPPS